ncbi:UDP-N-acetylenolpyruvoylglucosamine reductase [bacterium HR36]|nr:UDP-N-acetylenolpyruvoylglucosamine reductase [bacterium HR36]
MALTDQFAEILKAQEPLAPYTALQVGGRAQFLAEPRHEAELIHLLQCCWVEKLPVRILASGTNVLVRDEGVTGVVCRLAAPALQQVVVQANRVYATAGASLTQLITEAARHGLAGLESLIGIPGSVGGALHCSLGQTGSPLLTWMARVELLDIRGQRRSVSREEWETLAAKRSGSVVLAVEFELEPDDAESILRRLRRAWISRHARQPFFIPRTAKLFQEPRGLSLEQLLEQAGVRHFRMGGVALHERDANFIVVQPGTSAREILHFLEHLRHRLLEHTGHALTLELDIW